MRNYINAVQLLGYVGKDPEVKTLSNDGKLVRFSLATTSSYKDKNGEYQDVTKWHSLIAWNKVAERILEDVNKGSRLLIHGALDPRSYETNEGEKRYSNDIKVEQYYVLHQERRKEVEA